MDDGRKRCAKAVSVCKAAGDWSRAGCIFGGWTFSRRLLASRHRFGGSTLARRGISAQIWKQDARALSTNVSPPLIGLEETSTAISRGKGEQEAGSGHRCLALTGSRNESVKFVAKMDFVHRYSWSYMLDYASNSRLVRFVYNNSAALSAFMVVYQTLYVDDRR